ncbi:MAG: manganese efflux pump [Nitrospirae bacterium]|nr:manganese efflux pump [Nitrospirota bacterium]
MDIFTILIIAIGLAMDAFAVSIASGIAMKTLHVQRALTIGLFFGTFQAFMPVLGWFAGLRLRDMISSIDHWIAFLLLSAIGAKMIYEARKIEETEKEVAAFSIYILFVLSIATSIDALAVGLGFAFLDISIVTPVIVIGLVTFALSCIGVLIGGKFGHLFEKKIEIAGGIILIAIGTKILLEHFGVLG